MSIIEEEMRRSGRGMLLAIVLLFSVLVVLIITRLAFVAPNYWWTGNRGYRGNIHRGLLCSDSDLAAHLHQ
jgi:hypothetical protein